ncbi:hypothetical protein V2J09_022529 [Rumex salicifolius]
MHETDTTDLMSPAPTIPATTPEFFPASAARPFKLFMLSSGRCAGNHFPSRLLIRGHINPHESTAPRSRDKFTMWEQIIPVPIIEPLEESPEEAHGEELSKKLHLTPETISSDKGKRKFVDAYLPERDQHKQSNKGNQEEITCHPSNGRFLVASWSIPFCVDPSHLIRLLVQSQKIGPEPACAKRTTRVIDMFGPTTDEHEREQASRDVKTGCEVQSHGYDTVDHTQNNTYYDSSYRELLGPRRDSLGRLRFILRSPGNSGLFGTKEISLD